jgi:hypothetical protein
VSKEFEYEKSAREYAKLARSGDLPADFDQWGLADENGWTVAHTAALHGHLPVGFNMWDMSNNGGWTVAHAAVTAGIGSCPVIVSAQEVLLPENFDRWGLTDGNDKTVLSCISSGIQLDEYVTRWEKERPLCKTDADWEVFKKELPEIYQKYAISDHMLDADNDQEVSQGALL